MIKKILLSIIIFSASTALFAQVFFSTDITSGVFSTDQRPYFYLHGPGWLKIIVDGRELYWGRGPAYPELGVAQGEARSFNISAEYYTHDNILVESHSWYIFIDKIIPPPPVIEYRNSQAGMGFYQVEGKADTVQRAWADLGEELFFFQNLSRSHIHPHISFPALVWAEDQAGNTSLPVGDFLEISLVNIDNPLPGIWLNRQVLIVSGIETENVYWTSDGSDPLTPGGSGELYQGPVFINKDGNVTIRIAWQDRHGKAMYERVDYFVNPYSTVPDSLLHFSMAEEYPVRSDLSLEVPDYWQWALDNNSHLMTFGNVIPESTASILEDGAITLRPIDNVKRTVAVHLSESQNEGVYRFAYFLEGETSPAFMGNLTPPTNRSYAMFGDYILYSAPAYFEGLPFSEADFSIAPLRMLSAERSRLIVWPETRGDIYFSWGGAWFKGENHLPVFPEGGSLFWVLFESDVENPDLPMPYYGPFITSIESLPVSSVRTSGRIAYRNYDANNIQNWVYVSPLINYTPGVIYNSNFNSSDGEDLVWAFISMGGRILEQERRDLLPPLAPIVNGLPAGDWTRGPLNLEILPTEENSNVFLNVRLVYPSGEIEVLSSNSIMEVSSSLEDIASVYVEAYQIDSSGNKGPVLERRFILDPKTIYVSMLPLIHSPDPGELGGMDNPFTSLEDALNYALRNSINDINLSGTLELNRNVYISGDLRITGDWYSGDTDNRAIIITSSNSQIYIEDGSNVSIRGVRLLRGGGNSRLFNIEDSYLEIYDSVINIMSQEQVRDSIFYASNSNIDIYNTRIQLTGDYTLIFDLKDSTLNLGDCNFLVTGERTSTLFKLLDSRGVFNNFNFTSSANDYASILEGEASEIVFYEGSMYLNARDTSALFLNNSSCVIFRSHIEMDSIFSARAIDVRGFFPLIQESTFISGGSSARSEVFSLTEAAVSITPDAEGNTFIGFTHLMPGRPFE